MSRALILRTGLLLLGVAALVGLAAWSGLGSAWRQARGALVVLPLAIAVHAVQLFFGALSWRVLLAGGVGPGVAWRLRVVREGVDSLLPVAQVGGEIVGARLLARRGVDAALAGAATALDLFLEAATLPVVALLGLGTLWLLGGAARAWPPVLIAAGVGAAGAAGFGFAQRLGLLRLVEAAMQRLPAGMRVEGLHAAVLARLRDRRAMAKGFVLHVLAWSGGAFEVWLGLWALEHPVSLPAAFVIEAVGMTARGAGFAVPGALGVQEGGFVLGAGLFGIAAPTALGLSALKRVREVLVGLVGLWFWRADELRRSQVLEQVGGIAKKGDEAGPV